MNGTEVMAATAPSLDGTAEDGEWSPDPQLLRLAERVVARVREEGGATYYSNAHVAARWHLRFFEPAPVKCAKCPATEATVGGLVNGIHAALDWENAPVERLRIDPMGRIFSIAPDLDYIPLCRSCHRKHDNRSFRGFLPVNLQPAGVL